MGDDHTQSGPTPANSEPSTTSTAANTQTTETDSGGAPPAPDPDQQTITVTVQSEPITVDAQTTAGDLKDLDAVDASDTDVATFRDGNELKAVDDDEILVKHVPDGATVRFQPIDKKTDTFGSHQ